MELANLTDGAFVRIALVTRSVTGGIDPAALIRLVVDEALADLDADGGVFAVLRDGGMVDLTATAGYDVDVLDRFGSLVLDRVHPLPAAVRDGVSVWVPSLDEAALRFPALLTAASGSQAWAAIPLVAHGNVFGACCVSFSEPRAFTDAERLFLRALTDLCALALAPGSAAAGRSRPASAPAIDERGGAPRGIDAIEVAQLDLHGVIVEVNDAWEQFCAANGGDLAIAGVGTSYLDACDRAGGIPAAGEVGSAIRRVLGGETVAVPAVRFGCHAPEQERWFEALVSARSEDDRLVGATVTLTPAGRRARPRRGRARLRPAVREPEGRPLAVAAAEVDGRPGLVALVDDLSSAARGLLEGVVGVGLSLIVDGGLRPVASAPGPTVTLEVVQARHGQGPAFESVHSPSDVAIADLTTRGGDWPELAAAARRVHARAALSVPVPQSAC